MGFVLWAPISYGVYSGDVGNPDSGSKLRANGMDCRLEVLLYNAYALRVRSSAFLTGSP